MKRDLEGVALHLVNYEIETLPHVKESDQSKIKMLLHSIREECVQALLMMQDIDNLDADGYIALKHGIQAIKRKAYTVIYPERVEERMPYLPPQRRVE